MLFLTSWDDGHPSDLRLADMLCKYNLKGTFFVPASNKEGREVLAKEQLRRLNQNFEIGGHTLTHCYLNGLAADVLKHEICAGKAAIEDDLGHAINGFCYPGGVFDSRTIHAVKAAGFDYARTVENLCFDLGKSAWLMPTSFQFYPHSAFVLAKNAIKYPRISKLNIVRMRWREKEFMRFMDAQLAAAHHHSSVFHLWGHSWELDEYDLWGKLESFFKLTEHYPIQALTLFEAHQLKS
ncbi:polysaccharide deacetylase family protein [Iodobacter sp. HSC-16F04]|uniref:Polysaccharide deacetylase family protein n=1 Tax=Iodobacter violaceini TaxID=3044271 RepID=A0ABX0KNP8_9NEIS|nr:polysaccharide deacetylase family protein [Iodobacter violacea]NHQ85930.1 polysaccharide deacetylase family protein [Iodobacter violacea]